MKCLRCANEFNISTAKLNAEVYGSNVCACPHCGKAYIFSREISVSVMPFYSTNRDSDDWGNKIVTDDDYNSLKGKKGRTYIILEKESGRTFKVICSDNKPLKHAGKAYKKLYGNYPSEKEFIIV